MADTGQSSLSLPSTLFNSADSETKKSFASIVGQYTLLNHWKPRSRTEALWDKAVKNFCEEWSSPDSYAALYNAERPENILLLLNVKLEECKKNRTTYKSRNGTEKPIADLLYNIAIYLKRFTGLVGTGVSVDPIHAAGPWIFIQFFLNVALKGLTQFGTLVDGLEVIGRVVTRYGWIEKIYLRGNSPLQKDLEECILRLYTACLRYFDKAYTEFVTKRFKRIVNSLKPRASIDELLEKVEDAENEVQKVFALVEAEDLRQKFKSPAGVVVNSDSVITGSDRQDQRTKLSSWLKAVSTVDSYQNSVKSQTPGTNSWIFERDKTYKPWMELCKTSQIQLPKILWIHGSPGFGKTILFATIIERLMSQQKSDGFCLAYFFCNSSHEERRSPTAIIRSWIAQIVQKNDAALKVAYQVYLSAMSQSPDDSELWKILRLIATLVPCVLAIDGFDECTSEGSSFIFGTRNRKSQFLHELGFRLQDTNTRVLIMSRPHDDIKSVLQDLDRTSNIKLFSQFIGQDETTQDLLLCSRKMMNIKLADRRDSEQEEIALQAAEKSDGMFLYLNLLCQGLRSGGTTQTLRKTLSEMPSDLDFLYERELRRILELQGQRKKQALAILRWVLFAIRPLTVRELAEALVLTSDENELYYPYDALPRNWNKGFVDEAYIDATITDVGSLVELCKDEDNTLANKTVHLTHASVREYLLSQTKNKGLDLGLLDQFAENDHLAQLCLKYLCYGVFNKDYEKAVFRHRIYRFPFLFYATVSWYSHARSRKSSLSQDLEPDIERLFNSDTKNWQLWSQIFEGALTLSSSGDIYDGDVDGGETVLNDDDRDSVTSKAKSDVKETTEDEWDNPGYANSDDEEDMAHENGKSAKDSTNSTKDIEHKGTSQSHRPTPLYYAALLGLTNLVKSLKARGLDYNAPGRHFGFPLQAAIESGFSDTINYLLDEPNINVNQSGGFYGSAISAAAAAKGLTSIVKRLLDMNAHLDLTDSDGRNALYFACVAGQTEIAELLLKQNNDIVTVARNNGETPTVPAVLSGKAKLVALLRKHGANINAKDEFGIPVISRAISCGHRDIVKDLVLHHVDLESRNEFSGLTPLHYAAYYADDKVLRLLISHQADLHAVDKEKSSVMHCACKGRSTEAVKLLLERHAPFDTQDVEGYSPLHIAAIASPDIITLLLDAGSNIDRRTLGFHTPIMLTAEYKHFEATTLLIERRADPNIIGAVGSTALKSLLENIDESKDTIRRLLKRGNLYDLQTHTDVEDLKIRTDSCIMPLAIFEEVISSYTTQLISKVDHELEQGLPSQAELDSALLASVTFDSLPLVEAFLQRGAKASCTNMHMQTPLHIAVTQKNRESMVDLLIKHDAPTCARDSVCCTPLHVAVRLGKLGLAVIDKLLPAAGLFDDFDDPEALKPSEDIVRKFSGQWDGCYKYWSWSQSVITPTNITINFFDTPSPDKWHLPWFRYEGEDGAGAYIKYGFIYGNGEVRFLKMYDHYGWYSKGNLEVGTGEDERRLLIKGRWGESDERWHGTVKFKKVIGKGEGSLIQRSYLL